MVKILNKKRTSAKKIAKTENAINVLLMKQHQIGGKSTVNNSPPVPKVIYRVLVIRLRCASIKQIYKKKLPRREKKPKTSNETICKSYENATLKKEEILIKIAGTQSSLVRKSLEENFHDWMVVPWFLINKYIDKKIKFHKNLCASNGLLSSFPAYYQIVFVN